MDLEELELMIRYVHVLITLKNLIEAIPDPKKELKNLAEMREELILLQTPVTSLNDPRSN